MLTNKREREHLAPIEKNKNLQLKTLCHADSTQEI